MNNRRIAALLILVVMLLSGCTQNNGYIGPVFGSWALEEISEDGVPLKLEDETVFSFQNEVVQVMRIVDSGQNVLRFGNFALSDNVLSLTFLTELTPDVSSREFLMPTWLYFPSGQMPLMFDVVKLNGGSMELCLSSQGKAYLYRFRRTW